MWLGYNNFDHYYNFSQLNEFLEEAFTNGLPIVKTSRGVEYVNLPCAFDIETTSLEQDEEKYAFMYSWAVCINGSTLLGRTWGQFTNLCYKLAENLNLDPEKRILILYVHNLSYEFQFIRKRFVWEHNRVFSVKNRRPVYALCNFGIEFRCSYLLSNYSLAYIGSSMLTKYKVTKKVGLLDYSKIRTFITPLTQNEIRYQLDDVRVVAAYIQEKIEHDGSIIKIPLTNTGYVRKYCSAHCLKKAAKTNFDYRLLMKNLQIESEKEYQQLKKAFAGGFTHCNPNYSGVELTDVGSADLTSDYPYQMVADYFPMTRGKFIGRVTNEKLFNKLLKGFCCIFTAKFTELSSTIDYEHYISTSRCDFVSKDCIVDNGRLVSAEEVQITLTELDFDIINQVYEWDTLEICNMRVYCRGYLPRELVLSILDLYKNKTSLKGVEDKIIEYMVSKNMINASYGMAVTDIVRDEIKYDELDGWKRDVGNAEEQLVNYNKKFNRFLSYAWGVWVTAHARHCLWQAIMEFKDDYVYSDTDSVKGLNFEKHLPFFRSYNNQVLAKLAKMCKAQNIPLEMVMPKTIKGVKKVIGYWDIEEPYLQFKSIGAKRYIYEHEDHTFGMTVAGVNKTSALPYLLYEYGGEKYHTDEWLKTFQLAYDPRPEMKTLAKAAMKKVVEESQKPDGLSYFKVMLYFSENLFIPKEFTGKQTLTYIDVEKELLVTDYLGNTAKCKEYSAIHMAPASYSFSISDAYRSYLMGIRDASI